MKLLAAAVLLALFLLILWGPAYFVARRAVRRGDRYALRRLRVLFPCQLVGMGALAFGADEMGLQNPAAYIMAIMVLVAGAGAAILYLLQALASWRVSRRLG